jgi:hypothetical protein
MLLLTTTVTMNKVISIRIGKKHTMMTEVHITITLLEKQLMNILGEKIRQYQTWSLKKAIFFFLLLLSFRQTSLVYSANRKEARKG